MDKARLAEGSGAKGRDGLAAAVARYAFKLMAYKDEYEVARLYTDGAFRKKLERQFDGDYRLEFHLAPPLMAKPDPVTGRTLKRRFGPWMMTAFRVLAALRGLRGTTFDPFGRLPERRQERQLIADYENLVGEISANLNDANHALAVELAEIPEHIRGYGPIKDRAIAAAKEKEASLLAAFLKPSPQANAAE